MNKFKLFVENFLVYGLGGIISKIIPLIMIPIVVKIMPSTDYFGISDLSDTVVQFASALAIMGMYDAMYRMFFEKDDVEYKKSICSTSLFFTLCTSIIVFVVLILLKEKVASAFFHDKSYAYIVYISAMATLIGATNSIVAAPTRMQNKRGFFLFINTLSPLISYSISVPLLLNGYYTIALPLAAVIAGATTEVIFGIKNREWFSLRYVDAKYIKPLLIIAIPLMPNFLIYWVFNSCDRLMITNFLGMGEEGIYAVGAKLGHCSQLIYTAFAGGWQFFSFSTMKEENQVKNNSCIFEYLGVISFSVTAFVCAFSYPLFRILFPEIYISGYIVAPYLFLAPLVQMLFQVACNQFIIVKKTWPNLLILSTGALANVFGNYYLIPIIGIEGAAISTLLGYALSTVICSIVLTNMKLMKLEKRFIVASLAMVVFMVIWRLFINSRILLGVLAAAIITVIFVILYRLDLMKFINMIKKRN